MCTVCQDARPPYEYVHAIKPRAVEDYIAYMGFVDTSDRR
jgi:hypothetical protein